MKVLSDQPDALNFQGTVRPSAIPINRSWKAKARVRASLSVLDGFLHAEREAGVEGYRQGEYHHRMGDWTVCIYRRKIVAGTDNWKVNWPVSLTWVTGVSATTGTETDPPEAEAKGQMVRLFQHGHSRPCAT